MKSKIAEWGNSHGIRITSTMMDHLNIQSGEEVKIRLTDKGIEILRKNEAIIREVPIGTKNSYTTLADAKIATREILQISIAEAKKSQSELRQVGIDNISYIQL